MDITAAAAADDDGAGTARFFVIWPQQKAPHVVTIIIILIGVNQHHIQPTIKKIENRNIEIIKNWLFSFMWIAFVVWRTDDKL